MSLDVARAVMPEIRERQTNLEAPFKMFTSRPPNNAALPYEWVRDGADVPGPSPSIPRMTRGELLIDIWAKDRFDLDAIEKTLSFLLDFNVPYQGTAAGLTYRRARRSVITEQGSEHASLAFDVFYLELPMPIGLED